MFCSDGTIFPIAFDHHDIKISRIATKVSGYFSNPNCGRPGWKKVVSGCEKKKDRAVIISGENLVCQDSP